MSANYDEEIDDNNRLSEKNASTSPIKFQSLSLSDSVAPSLFKLVNNIVVNKISTVLNNFIDMIPHKNKLEGEAYSRLPKDLKILWRYFQKLKQKSSISKDDKEILIKLEKLFKNPIETLVDFELAERQNKQPIARLQFKEPLPPPQVAVPVNSASTQTSSIMADSYFQPNDTITSNDDSTLLETDNDSTLKDFSNEYIARQAWYINGLYPLRPTLINAKQNLS